MSPTAYAISSRALFPVLERVFNFNFFNNEKKKTKMSSAGQACKSG